jgi:DNA-binding GntR family transcriptional regulator
VLSRAFRAPDAERADAASPPLLRKVRDEHLRMIEALEQGRREELVALCIGHLQPPLSACVEAYEQLFGLAVLQRA